MVWNWQQKDWPDFRWDKEALSRIEEKFLQQSGLLIGSTKYFSESDKQQLVIDLITDEAIDTSKIEGEYLDRDSVKSSVLRNFGLKNDNRRVKPSERGVADMMTDLYKNYAEPLTHDLLFRWHRMLISNRYDIKDIGCYRTHDDPMQVVSGGIDNPKVHFEAPESKKVQAEMDAFMTWWHKTSNSGEGELPLLTRAGIAHLYLVCIHPFEDGNGRIARALAEKSLAETQGAPTMIALSQAIGCKRKAYYDALERNNKDNDITDWLVYFSNTILDAQRYSIDMVDFLIQKTKLYDAVKDKLNERQKKALERMFREGLDGFKGGLSAENYISTTGASRATATRDLQGLVEMGALIKTGALKSTRYHLNIPSENQ